MKYEDGSDQGTSVVKDERYWFVKIVWSYIR
jgi:hypothetical protein